MWEQLFTNRGGRCRKDRCDRLQFFLYGRSDPCWKPLSGDNSDDKDTKMHWSSLLDPGALRHIYFYYYTSDRGNDMEIGSRKDHSTFSVVLATIVANVTIRWKPALTLNKCWRDLTEYIVLLQRPRDFRWTGCGLYIMFDRKTDRRSKQFRENKKSRTWT